PAGTAATAVAEQPGLAAGAPDPTGCGAGGDAMLIGNGGNGGKGGTGFVAGTGGTPGAGGILLGLDGLT
ncbi:hypothetical protein C3474_23865, partial [Mycobacterium kansasii]